MVNDYVSTLLSDFHPMSNFLVLNLLFLVKPVWGIVRTSVPHQKKEIYKIELERLLLKLFKKIESTTGFAKVACKLIEVFAIRVVYAKRIQRIKSNHSQFDLLISNNHMEYFGQIESIIAKLSRRLSVALLFEGNSREFDSILMERFPDTVVISVNHRVLASFSCDVYLSSIAGKARYFPKASSRVFYFHGLAGIMGFKSMGMAHFTHIFCATSLQYSEVKEVYPTKHSLLVGYPKLAQNKVSEKNKTAIDSRIVAYAPTLRKMLPGFNQDIRCFDKSILKELCSLKGIQKVYYRPHPQELRDYGPSFFRNTIIDLPISDRDKVKFDLEMSQQELFSRVGILVTDYSGTAITFALQENKPVIYVADNLEYLYKLNPLARDLSVAVREPSALKSVWELMTFLAVKFSSRRASEILNHARADLVFEQSLIELIPMKEKV